MMADPSPAHATFGDDFPDHAHHWMIAKQDGPESDGVCKECGQTKSFVNGFIRRYATQYRWPSGPRTSA